MGVSFYRHTVIWESNMTGWKIQKMNESMYFLLNHGGVEKIAPETSSSHLKRCHFEKENQVELSF